MIQRLSLVAGWLTFAFIVCATLSPIDYRPEMAGPQVERFAAFALLGLAFAFGYRSRTLFLIIVVVSGAFVLEALQGLTPDRHGRVLDALVKAAGALFGIGMGRMAALFLGSPINRFRQSWRRLPANEAASNRSQETNPT
jgi:hypothetical protein